jgi:hypothetical protein
MSGPWQEYLEELYETYIGEGYTHEVAKAMALEDMDANQYDHEPEEDEEDDDGTSDSDD